DGVTFALSGDAVDAVETPGGGAADAVGLAAAAIILLLAFGSVLAMALPIVTAVFGIAVGLSTMALTQHLLPTPGFAPVLATMIGLGVGIDYALFIVTRYREGLAGGRTPGDAVVAATATAGRAVLFAGGTVVVGLCGLFLTGLGFLRGLAVGAAVSATGTSALGVVRVATAYPVRRSGDTWSGASYGDRTAATRPAPASVVSTPVTRCRTAGSSTPASARTARVTVSAAKAGKCSRTSCWAAPDGVSVELKSSLVGPP
ncbi:MMPL family transporter, partial [Micromonospora sp. NPDC003776]